MTTYKVNTLHEQDLDVTFEVWDDQNIVDAPRMQTLAYDFLLYS